jgi:hypothetical protein
MKDEEEKNITISEAQYSHPSQADRLYLSSARAPIGPPLFASPEKGTKGTPA